MGCVCCDFAAGDEITTTAESLRYDLARLQAATNNFSDENKIGEGGFGTVYKVITFFLCELLLIYMC